MNCRLHICSVEVSCVVVVNACGKNWRYFCTRKPSGAAAVLTIQFVEPFPSFLHQLELLRFDPRLALLQANVFIDVININGSILCKNGSICYCGLAWLDALVIWVRPEAGGVVPSACLLGSVEELLAAHRVESAVFNIGVKV